MKPGKLLLFGVVGLFVYSLIAKAQAGKKLNVMFRTLRILKPSGLNLPTIQAIFSLQNPSSQQIILKSIVGDLYLNGKHLSNVSDFKQITIPANNEIDLPINIKIGLFDVLSNIKNLINSKKKFAVSFEGNVNAENIVIPIKQTISV